ncbi:MAG: exosortase system-associated protein, TIGR04073 family [Candidatus Omnitrophica bacterium]|nr:exosortase system-associated protein, TIGR04073 family [Candidatus Omnitrophota bacterium]
MKKFIILSVLASIVVLSCPAHADNPIKKLQRGLSNIVVSPMEVPIHVYGNSDEKPPVRVFKGVTKGAIIGTFKLLQRAAVGVYEVGTFALPTPHGYKPIMKDVSISPPD